MNILKISTAYPDIDATLVDAIPLPLVKEYYENLMLNGSASNSSTRNQVYQNALNIFKNSLLWANDNNLYAPLNPLCKKIIENNTKKMQNYEIYIKGTNQKKGKMPDLGNLSNIHDIKESLEKVIY